jgi:RNase P subunit RPR2
MDTSCVFICAAGTTLILTQEFYMSMAKADMGTTCLAGGFIGFYPIRASYPDRNSPVGWLAR